jgi:hypothetical protein
MLNREQILTANDLRTEEVQVPEWGGAVLVRGMTGAERDRYEATVVQQNGKSTKVNMRNARARLVVMTVVDEDGKHLFSEADIESLSEKNAAALDRIFSVASRLSGIGDKDLDELSKNSLPGQSDDSIFD